MVHGPLLDSLSSIAEMLLGDRDRWQELFELNRGATTDDGQHQLAEPDIIWPGLRLQVPRPAEDVAEQEPETTPAELLVASAPTVIQSDAGPLGVAPAPTETPPASAEPDTQAPLPPLVRTPHALQPVVLDVADSPPADADSDASEPTPAPVAEAEVSVPRPPALPTIPNLPWVVGGLGLAGIGVAGLVFGARRLRRLRPLPQEPEERSRRRGRLRGGAARTRPHPWVARRWIRPRHGARGAGPAIPGRIQLERRRGDRGTPRPVSSTTVTLRCGLAEQSPLLDVASAFAERLEADVEACVSDDQDVVWLLVRLRKTRLLPTAESLEASPCLVPLGVLYDRQTYAATWGSLGHTLVVSLPGHGADTILASLLATVTARRSPEQLRVWLVASPRALPSPLFDLPHLARVVDPTDVEALGMLVEQLRAELDWRAAQELPVPDALIVIPELATLGEQAASLALLAARAAELGVRFAAASADPDDAAANPLTKFFATRMVLRMQAEDVSVALLGVADAAFLAGGGRLLLRLDGREPVELYGYRVAPEHLERLVKVMRSAYPTLPPTTPAALLSDPPPPIDEPTTAEISSRPPTEDASPAQGAGVSGHTEAPQSRADEQSPSTDVLPAAVRQSRSSAWGRPASCAWASASGRAEAAATPNPGSSCYFSPVSPSKAPHAAPS